MTKKIRLEQIEGTDGFVKKSGDVMGGHLRFPSGMMLTFGNNPNWGIENGGLGGLNFFRYGIQDAVLFLNDSTLNVGMGTTNPTEKLDVIGKIKATGGNSDLWNEAYNLGMLYKGAISGGSNYNNIVTPGRYAITSDAAQGTNANRPSDFSGVLEVTWSDGGNSWVFQRFQEYGGNRRTYTRSFYNGSWSPWVNLWNSQDFSEQDIQNFVNKVSRSGDTMTDSLRMDITPTNANIVRDFSSYSGPVARKILDVAGINGNFSLAAFGTDGNVIEYFFTDSQGNNNGITFNANGVISASGGNSNQWNEAYSEIQNKADIDGQNIPFDTYWPSLLVGGFFNHRFVDTNVGSNFNDLLVTINGGIFKTSPGGLRDKMGLDNRYVRYIETANTQTDLNNLQGSILCYGYNWLNSPESGIFNGNIAVVTTKAYSPDWISQEFKPIDGLNRIYLRTRYSGTTWSAWTEIVNNVNGTYPNLKVGLADYASNWGNGSNNGFGGVSTGAGIDYFYGYNSAQGKGYLLLPNDFKNALGIQNSITINSSGSLSNASGIGSNNGFVNQVRFDYNWANTGVAGSGISFGGFSGQYQTEIFGQYNGGNFLAFRTRNDDSANTWNPVREIWHDGNFNPDNKANINGNNIPAGTYWPNLKSGDSAKLAGIPYIDTHVSTVGNLQYFIAGTGNGEWHYSDVSTLGNTLNLNNSYYHMVRQSLLTGDSNNVLMNTSGTMYYSGLANSPWASSQDAIGSISNFGGKDYGFDIASFPLYADTNPQIFGRTYGGGAGVGVWKRLLTEVDLANVTNDYVSKLNVNEDIDGVKNFWGTHTTWHRVNDPSNAKGFAQSNHQGFLTGTLNDFDYILYQNANQKVFIRSNRVDFIDSVHAPILEAISGGVYIWGQGGVNANTTKIFFNNPFASIGWAISQGVNNATQEGIGFGTWDGSTYSAKVHIYNDSLIATNNYGNSQNWYDAYLAVQNLGNYVDTTTQNQIINSAKIFLTQATRPAIELQGNGSTLFPKIEFHQPNNYLASLEMRNNGLLYWDNEILASRSWITNNFNLNPTWDNVLGNSINFATNLTPMFFSANPYKFILRGQTPSGNNYFSYQNNSGVETHSLGLNASSNDNFYFYTPDDNSWLFFSDGNQIFNINSTYIETYRDLYVSNGGMIYTSNHGTSADWNAKYDFPSGGSPNQYINYQGVWTNIPTASYSSSNSNIVVGNTFERAALTGDVTAAQNSNNLTIPNDTVTFAKMQNITQGRLLGRAPGWGVPGDVEEITLGNGLAWNGSQIYWVGGGGGSITIHSDMESNGDQPLQGNDFFFDSYFEAQQIIDTKTDEHGNLHIETRNSGDRMKFWGSYDNTFYVNYGSGTYNLDVRGTQKHINTVHGSGTIDVTLEDGLWAGDQANLATGPGNGVVVRGSKVLWPSGSGGVFECVTFCNLVWNPSEVAWVVIAYGT